MLGVSWEVYVCGFWPLGSRVWMEMKEDTCVCDARTQSTHPVCFFEPECRGVEW